MKEVFVVEALRTPFGSFNGVLADVAAPKLAATVMQALLEKTGVPPQAIEEVVVGQVLSGGCGQAPARQAMRAAGIPDAAHALTVNKVCGSGLQAVMTAGDRIRLGEADLVLAGGMESMSQAPFLLKQARTGYRMGHGELHDLMIYDGLQDPYSGRHMGEIGEANAEANGLTRAEQDAFALRSYQLARAAVEGGVFDAELAPVVKRGRKGEEVVARDEEPFKMEPGRIAELRAVFKKDGGITAANASSLNDGAAIALLASQAGVEKHGLTAKARIVASATASCHPDQFPEAPVAAIEKICQKAGLSSADIDLFEINEAFATVALLAVKSLRLPLEKVNVNGGACAIGHPIGASGGRLLATVVRELHVRQQRYGLVTLCIGGGEAVAAIVERM